ncbi:hypothetical protein Val02_48490 [Virgisporangium aliadipatigenens]|uniref:Uncharacterized protein n=1 Tax=Virgisporangium aliadipatigenens TaxID=741659 RepID=A0A8J3YQI9_9ACTN|nr:GGDEF domain-containing phosphodiesterase [Virgisporangium aliadipatigenens]GIJ47963.1 hypothetical protein Val02_48490 [Virgisporangium aliadipatigenens]
MPRPWTNALRPPTRHNRWWRFLVVGVLVVCAAQLAPPGVALALWSLPQALGLVATVAMLWRRPAGSPLGWWLLLSARAAGLAAVGYWAWQGLVNGVPPTSTQMGLSLAAQYALFAFAGLLLTRRRRAGSTAENGVEAGAVVLFLSMLAWSFVVRPYLAEPSGRQVDTGVAAVYALIDLAILAVVLRGLGRRGGAPQRLLGGAAAALLAGHLVYAATSGQGAAAFLPGGVAFLLTQVAGVLLTAAALHPRAAELGRLDTGETRLINRPVLIAYLVTAVLSPLLPVLAGLTLDGADAELLVPSLISAALCGLLMSRIWLLVRIAQHRARRLDTQADELRAALHRQQALQHQLTHRATHDTLTGLANRDLFLERLDVAAASGEPHGVVLCGLDGFKEINDAHGHGLGDRILTEIAARLRVLVDATDTLARLGGDEFAVLLTRDPGRAGELARSVGEAVARPVVVAGHRLHLTVSIGIVETERHSPSPTVTLANADLALTAAKQAGRDRAVRCDDALRSAHRERTEIADGLRRALHDGSLYLHYQPVVDTATGEMAGVEALMRWDRDGQAVPPATFIPMAEATGMIDALGRHALLTACRQALDWHLRSGLHLAVNVSVHQLRSPDFVESVLSALAESGLPAPALVLEITESALIDTAESAIAQLRTLRAHGIRIAIDDFGTGYSSLAYLHTLPVDILKIDRSFIMRHTDSPRAEGTAVTRAIVDLAGSLRLATVAEGVETGAQAELLRRLGCSLAQGYHFSRPVPPERIAELLERRAALAA